MSKTTTLITSEEIRTELGWSDHMVRSLLPVPDAPASVHGKYKCVRYNRERVLATTQTEAARAAKLEWDEMLGGPTPNPGLDNTAGRHRRGGGHLSGRCRKYYGTPGVPL